jgi:hypothetical protein
VVKPLTPLDVAYARTLSGTRRRIYELLTEMGTAQDKIWPFPSQPFTRSPGPLTPGHTEEWHGGLHSVLLEAVPEERIVWEIKNEGFTGTHGFYLSPDGKKTRIEHRITAELSDTDGRMMWRRIEYAHQTQIEALFDKLTRVLKR